MAPFNFGGHSTMCAVDDGWIGDGAPPVNANTRLLLFKPEGLTAETRSHREVERPIASDIYKPLVISIPDGKHLIVAGYKTMLRESCLGRDCYEALGFSFPLTEVVSDDFNLRPEDDNHPANSILDCDYFEMLSGYATFCNPNDNHYPRHEKGYHAEINILESGSLEFVVNGKLSLRYLDIYLKSRNSKIQFSGRGIVEFTEVGLYGEAALESIVSFGDSIQVIHKINPRRLRSSVSYGLGLFANHEGIQNFIAISNPFQAVTALTYWFDHDLLYPQFKLAFPGGADGPNPFLIRDNFFPDQVFCYKRSSEEQQCELDSNHHNLGLVIGLEPKDGGANDLNAYHFVHKSIIPLESEIPVVEDGVYYTDEGDQIQIETREVTENQNLQRGSSKSADEENAEREKEISPSRSPDLSSTPCPSDTARNAEGFCVRTSVNPAGSGEDDADLDEQNGGTQIATPGAQVERNPWAPHRDLLESNENGSGCSLNRNGKQNSIGWLFIPIFLLLLLGLRARRVHWMWFGCLAVILLFPVFSALGSEPEEINFSCIYYHPENPNYQSSDSCEIPLYNRPCVVLNRRGTSSLEALLDRLDASMSLFNYGEHNTMCAVDDAGYGEVEPVVNSNTRLLLFKPEGLTRETRSHHELERPIPSDIGKVLQVNVPQERHLIIAGYKAMVRESCLGHDCGDTLGFYFPIREVVADDFNLRPELDYHPANPILNCDYFDMLGHSSFCNPNDGTYAYHEKGYHAEINILEGGSLEFIVDGKLSLRYLDIHLKSGNSKIKFSGRGIVEFTEVGIYGEAALESIVEFGDAIQVRHKINPRRLRSSVSYGLGLFANHEGIQNFIAVSNLFQAVTALNYWFDHDLLYPKFKLAFPAGADGPNPFLVRENFFPDPVFCYQRSSKEEECELDSNHRNLGLVISLEPKDGGDNDLNTYHFVHKSITPLDGKIPVVENGVYYTDGGDSIQIETREVAENPNLKKGSSQSADEEKAEGEKEIPPSNPPDLSSTLCPPDTVRNAEGFCVRTTDEDEVELDERRGGTQIARPEAEVERNPWPPNRDLLESNDNGSGCSLNRNGNSQGWMTLPLLLLILFFFKLKATRINVHS